MTINEAIWSVITTQHKKDMDKDALKMVKSAGYEVGYRANGSWWEVLNPENRKRVYIHFSRNKYTAYVDVGYSTIKILKWDKSNIDFNGYLQKPFNTEYHATIGWGSEYMPTRRKYDKLTSARWNVKYERSRVDRLKKEIAEKQRDLEDAIRRLVKDENELNNVKKELGLAK